MNKLEYLADIHACTALIHRLARGLDRCDAALLSSVFHPDATDDHGMFKGTARDFVIWVIPRLKSMTRTQHVIGQVLIETDGDVARGESYFVAYHTLSGATGDTFLTAAGRYLDRFERRDGAWKIAHRLAVYDWSSSVPLADVWDRAAPGPSTFGARDRTDASYAHFAGES